MTVKNTAVTTVAALLVALGCDVTLSAPADAARDPAYQNEMLAAVNAARLRHAAPFVTLDAGLNTLAQNWAQRMADTGHFANSHYQDLGEDIDLTYGPRPSAAAPVNDWYSKGKGYDYTGDNALGALAFTQLIWKSSTRIGAGTACAPTGNRACYFVVEFSPPGNYTGAFKDNVAPPVVSGT